MPPIVCATSPCSSYAGTTTATRFPSSICREGRARRPPEPGFARREVRYRAHVSDVKEGARVGTMGSSTLASAGRDRVPGQRRDQTEQEAEECRDDDVVATAACGRLHRRGARQDL